jgi:hypothetical protein
MTWQVLLRARAEADLKEARDWYEERQQTGGHGHPVRGWSGKTGRMADIGPMCYISFSYGYASERQRSPARGARSRRGARIQASI